MRIRYPGPKVPAERRAVAEYVNLAGGLPLPVSEVVEVPRGEEEKAQHLVESGLVELVVQESREATTIHASASFQAEAGAIDDPAAHAAALESGFFAELPPEIESTGRRNRR